MRTNTIATLDAIMAKATPGPLILTRYAHGGGRLYKDDPRTLVADFYHEGDREAIMALMSAWPALRGIVMAAQDLADATGHERATRFQDLCSSIVGLEVALQEFNP